MSQYFKIHPENPQARLIDQSVAILKSGGVIAYPTDTSYALGCMLDSKKALERIRAIRRLDDDHEFSLICEDISQVSQYIKLTNEAYRLMKHCFPGPYTFIVPATKEVPRRLKDAKRKTIGLRVPNHEITQALLASLGEAMYTTTLQLPGDEFAMSDPHDIQDAIGHAVDLVIDGGHILTELSTVICMTENFPTIIREGIGPIDFL